MTPRRLAVWGDPIAHSKSPQLHAAAYAALGRDWEYTRRQVDEATFGDALGALDESWRGLSLTMPLKEKAHRAAVTHDRYADLTGAVNTLLLTDGIRGFNTDVGGIIDALDEQRLLGIERVRILGAGATASSALVACVEAGARSVDVRARRPERAADLVALGRRLGVAVSASPFDADAVDVGLTVATLPGGTALDGETSARLSASGGVLFDVAYSPWPSALASVWNDDRAVSGEGMLLRQAVRQVRIFLHGDQRLPLPSEEAVVAAMKAAL
ncbi:shikimate dehydrogenase [Microbacterium sp. APC 3901]|uniref:shikimate dehydrogenase n=1 Tax=Microbacterium sp. APC 3901 TaxID=3035192 RepID=UPI0025B377C0|nr:shikimate dehydrogenase [Microbacterium sp. APC 3901]MDN3443944.1 shikimate dehydrogenase [Microbacterium sp. APC 3901]